MTRDEEQGLLIEQRHTYLDLDADSTARPTDRDLCHHGRPLASAELECPDCGGAQGKLHNADYEPVGEIHMCRECGRSMGTHGDKTKGQKK